jgi:transglutaminase-like putative cysteine protease
MSLWRDDPRPTRATLASLAALAFVAAASMSRLVQSPAHLKWTLPALVTGAAFAFAFGKRSLGLGLGILVVLGIASLPALFARSTTNHLLPTASSLRVVRHVLASGLAAAPRQAAPVNAEPRFLILIWITFVLLGFLCASWVIVRRPVGAVISIFGVVTFSGSIGDGPGRTAYAIAAIAAAGAFFLSEGRHRIARWGGRANIPVWLGLPTLGAACLIALAAPVVLGEQPIVQVRSALRPRLVIIKPLSDIKRQLKVDPPIEVMRVTSGRPTYWRLTGLDTYDGSEWFLEAKPREVRNGVIPAPKPPTTGDVIEQSFRLTSLLSPWMPAAYAALSVDAPTTVDVDGASQTLLLRGSTTPGLAYTVRSRLPHVDTNTPGKLHGVSDANEKLFGGIARPIVAGARTPLDMSQRLVDYFHRFAYSEDVEGGHSAQRLQRFLQDRTGYCEQFAATMTLMLRGLGVDARVGVGFLPGARAGGEYIVSTRDAHAWVEVNVPTAGWTNFDPTPGRGATAAAPSTPQARSLQQQALPKITALPAPTPQMEDIPSDVTNANGTRIPAAAIWAGVGLLVLGAIPAAKRVRRRSRVGRRSADPGSSVLGAYAEFVDRARDLGSSPELAETHREFCIRALGEDDESASHLASLSARTLYGPTDVGAEERADAWGAERAAVTGLRRRAPGWRRVLAVFDPRTFIPEGTVARLRRRVAVFGRA